MYHSDGCIYAAVEDLIACGFHAVHPIEPKAMDIVRMKWEYGDRLAFVGNIDLGYTLTRFSPAEVEAEVREPNRDGRAGGDICRGLRQLGDRVRVAGELQRHAGTHFQVRQVPHREAKGSMTPPVSLSQRP